MVDIPSPDSLSLAPLDVTPAQPSIAEQKRQHAADNPPPPSTDGLSFTPGQPPSPGLMNSSWSQLGKTLWDEGTRGVGLGTRAVMEGLGSIPGVVGDVLTYPGRALGKAIGFQPPDYAPDMLTAPSTQIQNAINATNLPTPATPTEANTSTIVRAAAPATLGGFNPAATIPSLVRTTVAGGTGGLAGEKVAQSDLVPPYLKPSVNLLVSMLAAKGADVATNLGYKLPNALSGSNMSPEYDAFRRLQMPTSLVGTVGGGEAGQSAEAALTRVPFASSIIRPVQQSTVDAFGNAVDRTALQLDPNMTATNAQQTGENVRAAARNWRDNIFPQQQAAAWNPLNQRLAGTSVDLSGYKSALDSVTKQLSLPETQTALTPALATKLSEALAADVPGGTVQWGQAQQLRTLIGKVMGVPEIANSIGTDTLKRAYAGIASDMRNTAVANGQGSVFDAANQVSTDGHAFINGPLSKVISTNNPAQERITPEQATNSLLNSGDTTLQAIRNNMPDAADQLAAYKLRQMATAKPSQATAYDDTSTGTFLTNTNRMRQNQPGGYTALYGNDPAVQQQLDDLQTAAGRLRTTERHLNTSGTAEQLGWMEYLRAIGDALGEGRWGKAISAATIPPTIGVGGGRLITSPALTRYVAAQGAGPPLMPPTTAGLLGSIPQLTGQ